MTRTPYRRRAPFRAAGNTPLALALAALLAWTSACPDPSQGPDPGDDDTSGDGDDDTTAPTDDDDDVSGDDDSGDDDTTGDPPPALPPCVDDGSFGLPTHTIELSTGDRDIVCRPADDVFTLMVIPDTQIYVAVYPEMFDAQTHYVHTMYDHPDNNTIFAMHLGDLVDNPLSETQWTRARTAMDELATWSEDGVRHYVPYDIAWGDHDLQSYQDADDDWPVNLDDRRPKHGEYITGDESDSSSHGFGVEVYKDRHTSGNDEWWKRWFIGYDFRNEERYGRNAYHFFDAGGDPYMVLLLEHCPSQDVLDWAAERLGWFAAGPHDRRVILVMHSFLSTRGGLKDYRWLNRTVEGEYIAYLDACWEFNEDDGQRGIPSDVFEQLIEPHNVHFVLSAHDNGSGFKGGTVTRIEVPEELSGTGQARTVHALLSNYQHIGSADGSVTYGGLGYMRVMRFYPTEDRVVVRTWSPYSYHHNGNVWNATYEPGDTDKLYPKNFRGDPDDPFNENAVCVEFAPVEGEPGQYPGACASDGFDTVEGLCADLDSFAPTYAQDHDGRPYRSMVARCNQFRLDYPMSAAP